MQLLAVSAKLFPNALASDLPSLSQEPKISSAPRLSRYAIDSTIPEHYELSLGTSTSVTTLHRPFDQPPEPGHSPCSTATARGSRVTEATPNHAGPAHTPLSLSTSLEIRPRKSSRAQQVYCRIAADSTCLRSPSWRLSGRQLSSRSCPSEPPAKCSMQILAPLIQPRSFHGAGAALPIHHLAPTRTMCSTISTDMTKTSAWTDG